MNRKLVVGQMVDLQWLEKQSKLIKNKKIPIGYLNRKKR